MELSDLSRTCRSFLVVMTRELRGHWRNPLVWGLVLFAALLAGVSAHLGALELRDRIFAYTELMAQRTRDLSRSDRQLTGWRMDPALRAIRAPGPLSAIVTGRDVVLPDFWDFTPAGRRTGRQYARSDLQERIDLEFVIRVVLGLLALILVLESIAGERANGTLLALMSEAVRRDVIFAAKITAGAVTLGVSVAITLGVALAGTSLTGTGLVTAEFATSLALVGFAGCLYLFTYFTVGALVSSAVSSYRMALAATTIVWLFGGVVALPLIQLVASNLAAMPPESLVQAESERIWRSRTEEAEHEIGTAYLDAVPAGEQWSRADRDPAWVAATLTRLEPIWERHVTALAAELAAVEARAAAAVACQQRIVRWVSLASPGAQFAAGAMNLAGTGDTAAGMWESATATYQQTLNRLLFHDRPRLTGIIQPRTQGPGAGRQWEVGLNRRPFPTLETVPGFQPPPGRGAGGRLADAAPYLIVLAAYAVVLVATATVAFRRIRF